MTSRTRIYINPLGTSRDRARRPKTILFMRATDGPRVNAMILLTGYACLPKSISGQESSGTSFAVESERAAKHERGGWP